MDEKVKVKESEVKLTIITVDTFHRNRYLSLDRIFLELAEKTKHDIEDSWGLSHEHIKFCEYDDKEFLDYRKTLDSAFREYIEIGKRYTVDMQGNILSELKAKRIH